MLRWEVKPIEIKSLQNNYESAIILGGITDTERPPFDRLHFQQGADRVTQAIHLYRAGVIEKIVFTGGSGRLFKDAEKNNNPVRLFFQDCGISNEDIIIESKSRNTHENAMFTSELIDKNRPQILITSGYHMRRSIRCFEKENYDITAFSCNFYTVRQDDRFTFMMLIPSNFPIYGWELIIKEWAGMIAYKLAGYI